MSEDIDPVQQAMAISDEVEELRSSLVKLVRDFEHKVHGRAHASVVFSAIITSTHELMGKTLIGARKSIHNIDDFMNEFDHYCNLIDPINRAVYKSAMTGYVNDVIAYKDQMKKGLS